MRLGDRTLGTLPRGIRGDAISAPPQDFSDVGLRYRDVPSTFSNKLGHRGWPALGIYMSEGLCRRGGKPHLKRGAGSISSLRMVSYSPGG